MNVKKRQLGFIFIFFMLMVTSFVLRDYIANRYVSVPAKNISPIQAGTRLLVIAPHADDEALGCAGFIKKVLDRKGIVKIVIITNGDGSKESIRHIVQINKPSAREYVDLGIKRHGESLAAMQRLGISKEHILFLGYPDGGTDLLWSKHWQTDNPFFDPDTKTNRSPYNFSYSPESAYSGENEARDLKRMIETFKPTIILYPHPDDHHKDHWATYAFVKMALEQSGLAGKTKELLYLVHYEFWPAPYGKHLTSYLKPPSSLVNPAYTWMTLPLTKNEETEKQEVLMSYQSQIKKMASFLYSFARKNELFAVDDSPRLKAVQSKTFITDPRDDYLLGLIRFRGGIEQIEAVNHGDGFLFTLHIKGKIKSGYTYVLDLTFFKQNLEPEKITISIFKEKMDTFFHSGYQLKSKKITWVKNNDSISVKVPYPSNEMHQLLVSASVLKKTTVIDRTGWKVISY